MGISDDEVSFERRGFRGADEPQREHLETVGRSFVSGYRVGLAEDRLDALATRLDTVASDYRGFAYEGAAMALTLRDAFRPWGKRVPGYLAGPAAPHTYLAHVGVGWALARLPGPPERYAARMDPVLGWLVIDGFGFHHGFFGWPRAVSGQVVPRRLGGYARRVFDQGLGRSLWFVEGAGVERIAGTIAAFAPGRRSDLWSGIGLACAYAGGVPRASVESLRGLAGRDRPALAQGAGFAALARVGADNVAPWTELACEVLCGGTVAETAALVEAVGARLNEDDRTAAKYELWRRGVQELLAEKGVASWSQPAALSNAMP
jgi:hypothetical protein